MLNCLLYLYNILINDFLMEFFGMKIKLRRIDEMVYGLV